MADHRVVSEITGSVWKVLVKAGDTVKEGDPLLVIESMKMEIELLAPADGVVKSVTVAEGDPIAEGDVPVTIAG
jgi:biotin carboxyl carrier protein